jgi:NitT/TauT family transport system permease protein
MRWINRRPDRATTLVLATLPFVLLLLLYLSGSAVRLAANPADKLLPSPTGMARALGLMLDIDPRTGTRLFWADTAASLIRLAAGLGIATATALLTGIVMGMFPYARATLSAVTAALSMVPPLALLPILFIVMGLGEASKIALIAIGITPVLIRDLALRILELPREQFTKALTLGASSWQIALRVVLPQSLPRLLTSLRLQLGPAWLFLIAAEAISSEAGLGYRIFLVRRFLAMDVIFPYVLWITLLAVAMNLGLEALRRAAFPWADLDTAR